MLPIQIMLACGVTFMVSVSCLSTIMSTLVLCGIGGT